jgi:hypothetical protein
MNLTERDLDLVETLTRRVRLAAVTQVAMLWWPETRGLSTARSRLRCLVAAGLIERHFVNAHPLLPVTRPLVAWKPGDDDPDTEHVAAIIRNRWREPSVPTEICVASAAAANIFGSTARGLPALEHRDHDLRLASVYFHFRAARPRQAKLWTGEHALPKAGYRVKDPDAFLVNANGDAVRVIESAGRYSVHQVAAFHEHCSDHELPYELW